jgi:hypothetical protein
MTTLLTAFNTQLATFIDELILLCPEDNDFKLFKNAFLLLKRTNPRQISVFFTKYISDFKKKIVEKDETFFLDNSYETVTQDIDSPQENILMTINKIKNYWKDLSDTNKENIWKYLSNLIKLNDLLKK